jgi:hypothetical protein
VAEIFSSGAESRLKDATNFSAFSLKKVLPLRGGAEYLIIAKERLVLAFAPMPPYELFSSVAEIYYFEFHQGDVDTAPHGVHTPLLKMHSKIHIFVAFSSGPETLRKSNVTHIKDYKNKILINYH